jgi:hypothetical protein
LAKSLIEPALLRSITQRVQVLEGEEAVKAWKNWTNAKVLQFLKKACKAKFPNTPLRDNIAPFENC